MISNYELKKQVNAFYRDVIGLYEKRFDNNIKAFYNIRANEERIENEISEIKTKMNEINDKEGNHINNDKTFNLTPDAFLSYDRLEKIKIIAAINNRDFVDVLREANAQRQIYEERKKQNDEIFGKYLSNKKI